MNARFNSLKHNINCVHNCLYTKIFQSGRGSVFVDIVLFWNRYWVIQPWLTCLFKKTWCFCHVGFSL